MAPKIIKDAFELNKNIYVRIFTIFAVVVIAAVFSLFSSFFFFLAINTNHTNCLIEG